MRNEIQRCCRTGKGLRNGLVWPIAFGSHILASVIRFYSQNKNKTNLMIKKKTKKQTEILALSVVRWLVIH
jgi:hypothetical protein